VCRDLTDADAYPHAATDLRHIHTHISDVFVAGDRAYKLKRPVDLGFVDFSTLKKRRAACEDELRLNRRLAPDVYLAVVPICNVGGHARILPAGCPSGEPVEYAVQMRRMPADGMLDELAARGGLAREHMIDIARQVAEFHARADRGTEIARYGRPEAVAAPMRENFAQTEKYVGVSLDAGRFASLRDYAEAFVGAHTTLFEARIAAGRIVDGHGDLHLRNMCLMDGRVVIFDCIEFNRALRAGDAISDIAFLTMDLDDRSLSDLGNVFLNAYLERSGDYAGLRLLDFYQVYRAYVRGKVISFLLDEPQPETERAQRLGEARAYFDLAERYLAPRAPALLITCGVSGSGKTTVARAAAERLAAVTVRSDVVRKQLAGVPLEPARPRAYGAGIYTAEWTDRTYASLLDHARDILAAGRRAILDASYATRRRRAAARALAAALGVPFVILHCSAERAELERRLDARQAAGRDVSDATRALLDEQFRRFEPPDDAEGAVLTVRDPAALEALAAAIVTARPRSGP
jgi:aminoglycoside phosphotransferase family enzyme/predicted kinase